MSIESFLSWLLVGAPLLVAVVSALVAVRIGRAYRRRETYVTSTATRAKPQA